MRYDIDAVKSASADRWPEIFAALAKVPAELFNRKHHSCPKCGGRDRFRFIDSEKGAAICNQCFTTKNGDGIAVLQWLNGWDFKQALSEVARHVGVNPTRSKKEKNPEEHLEFLPWNDSLVGLWCLKKKPITPEAIKLVGGRLAKYRSQFNVICLPVLGANLDTSKPIGWVIFRIDGGTIPVWLGGQISEHVKIKTMPGTGRGIIGWVPDNQGRRTLFKTEGPTDLLSLLSAGINQGDGAFCNIHGAKENPVETPFLPKLVEGHDVIVVHDRDKPGLEGATQVGDRPGWSKWLAQFAASARVVDLPYELAENHGKDLRDYFLDGNKAADLYALAESTDLIAGTESTEQWVDEAEDDPHRLARVNLENYRAAGRDLRNWRGEWYQYKGDRYVRMTRASLENRVGASIKSELDRQWKQKIKEAPGQPVKVRKVTSRLVSDVVKATGTYAYVKDRQEMNAWLDDGPKDCIAMKNGILCLSELFKPSGERDDNKVLLPHSARWFSTTALDYEFDPTAKCPTWMSFLEDVFNSDQEAITALRKWFGYLLLPDTSLHKMMFVIGRPRSGKGTVMRTLINMMGRSAVASPTLNDLSGPFALHGLLEKTVAVIGDARLSGRADEIGITERLLSITGEDPQDVHRKYLETLHAVRLPLRFTLFSNVLPKLSDSSAAFMTRCIFLRMPNTYVGKEDLDLGNRISQEMSGILNWAIAGRYELQQDKKIVQPESGMQLKRDMQVMISPISVFIDQCCEQSGQVEPKDLFDHWNEWARENDVSRKIDLQNFGKKIRDVLPGVDVQRIQIGGTRTRFYKGISIRRSTDDSF